MEVWWLLRGAGRTQLQCMRTNIHCDSAEIFPFPPFLFPKTGRPIFAVVMDCEIRLCAVTNFACVL